MIPKIIHYCWFGNHNIPDTYAKFIEGWKQNMPDYELKLWNESNSPMDLSYMQEALRARCWANLSNYARLHAIYHEGGIYLDTDVEIIKNLDPLLELECFFGFESNRESRRLLINNAVFGAIPKHPFIAECKARLLSSFPGSEPANLSAPDLVTSLLRKKGMNSYGRQQIGGVQLLEHEYFYPHGWKEQFSSAALTPNTYAVHHWGRSWWNSSPTQSIKEKQPSRKSKSRQMLSIYKHFGMGGVKLFRDQTVLFGPFQGMKFKSRRNKSETFAKLIGCHNTCTHQLIYALMENKYEKIVVAGAEDGYYVSGFARMFPGVPVYAQKAKEIAGDTISENLAMNGLSERVSFLGEKEMLNILVNHNDRSRFFVFSISDDSSRLLLKQDIIERMANADIIAVIPVGMENGISAFRDTHDISVQQERAIPVPIFQYLERSRKGKRLLNLTDRRKLNQPEWIFLRSKASDVERS